MSHLEDPSPTPTGISMAPPVNASKRPRPSAAAAAAAAGGASTATVQPRAKRRKPEDSVGPDDRRAGAAGKVKDEEGEGEIHTKIDFRDLPVETLYKYLEIHDLLPRWEPSPWSEEPCIAPNALYANPPPAPPAASPRETQSSIVASPPPTVKPTDFDVPPASTSETTHIIDGTTLSGPVDGLTLQNTIPQSNDDRAQPISTDGADPETNTQLQTQLAEQEAEPEPESEPTVAPPTTRSKTAPSRRVPTPPPPPKRGVITLSDMYAARDVLAEKANAHWIKGLGGGQNKESETIVNFLYKMKVGPGRLLRVYNPNYPQ